MFHDINYAQYADIKSKSLLNSLNLDQSACLTVLILHHRTRRIGRQILRCRIKRLNDKTLRMHLDREECQKRHNYDK